MPLEPVGDAKVKWRWLMERKMMKVVDKSMISEVKYREKAKRTP
jgi:hypothetical protein